MNRKIVKILFFGTLIISMLLPTVIVAQKLNGSFENKFKRYQKNEEFNGTETLLWNSIAWKGERVYKQIVLWSDTDINNLEYVITDLGNEHEKIQASSIKLQFGKYVKGDPEARSCSEYPTHPTYVEIIDALSNEQINTLQASDPVKFWVVIDIPETTVAGTYSGTISVNGGSEPSVFTMNIEVVNYTLPKVADWDFHLDLWQFPVNILNHYNNANPSSEIIIWSDEHFDLLEPAYKLLANTGQKAITAYIKGNALGAESMVKWVKKTDGSWEYNFTAFDKYVTTLMSWGITKQINCFSPVGWNESTIPYWDEATNQSLSINAPLGSATYNTRWNHFLSEFKIHLDSKGWFDKTVLFLDEVSEEKLNKVTSLVYSNNPNWKLGIAYSHGLSEQTKANFYDLSGILESASNNGISEDKISTFYTSCTQKIPNSYVTSENSAAEMTWMCWHALNQEYDGYLRWAYDYWRLDDPFDSRDGAHTAGDFALIYRSSNTKPIEYLPSLRLEMLREGIEDYQKVMILKDLLEASSVPADQEKLQLLNNVIAKFGKTSGVNAKQLVTEAQNKISYLVDVTLSNKEYPIKKSIRIYPNPLSGRTVTIEIPGINDEKVKIILYNSHGGAVYTSEFGSFSFSHKLLLPENLPQGLYFMQVETKSVFLVQKVLIR